MSDTDLTRKLWWAVPVGGLLLLVLLAILFPSSGEVKSGTSYDAGDDGFRAAYLRPVRPRRRDQPGDRQDAVGPARGDAGAPGNR
jgi:hypothetical protein